MKREFLEGLGLDRDTIDAVLNEYGRGIEGMRQRCGELENQCDALKEKLPVLERRAAELGDGLAESEKKYGALIDSVITRAVSEAGFSSLLAEDAARRLIREEAERGEDVFTVIDALRDADPEAFGGKKLGKPYFSAPPAVIPSGFSGGDGFTRRRM